jgi:hypothetical protein
MPLLIVGDEKNLTALRSRLFEGRVSAAAVGRVSDALKAANPGVNFEKLRPGIVLTIPDLPELAVGDLSLDDTVDRSIETLRKDLATAIETLTNAATVRSRADAAERKRVRPALDADEVRAAAARDPAVASDLKAAIEALDADEAAAKERIAALKKAAEEWTAELEALSTIRPRT